VCSCPARKNDGKTKDPAQIEISIGARQTDEGNPGTVRRFNSPWYSTGTVAYPNYDK